MDQDEGAEGVDNGGGRQRQRHAKWDVSVWVFDLLRDTGHLGEAGIGDEDQSDCGGKASQTGSEEVLASAIGCEGFAPANLGDAEDDERGEDDDECCDESSLQEVGLLGPDDVQNAEGHGQDDRQQGERNIEVQAEVRAHADECECTLEDDSDPGAEPADRSHHRAHCAVEEVVRSTGLWHGGGEFCHGIHGREDQESGEKVREIDAVTGECRGDSGQQKETGAEHRSRRNRVDVEEGEILFELVGHGCPFSSQYV